MNREQYLPIGSVVMLKSAKKRVMITGFAAKGKEAGDKLFDYVGCLFPEGVISSEKNLLFNHDQIDKIFYLGYSDDEETKFKIKLDEVLNKQSSNEENKIEQPTTDDLFN